MNPLLPESWSAAGDRGNGLSPELERYANIEGIDSDGLRQEIDRMSARDIERRLRAFLKMIRPQPENSEQAITDSLSREASLERIYHELMFPGGEQAMRSMRELASQLATPRATALVETIDSVLETLGSGIPTAKKGQEWIKWLTALETMLMTLAFFHSGDMFAMLTAGLGAGAVLAVERARAGQLVNQSMRIAYAVNGMHDSFGQQFGRPSKDSVNLAVNEGQLLQLHNALQALNMGRGMTIGLFGGAALESLIRQDATILSATLLLVGVIGGIVRFSDVATDKFFEGFTHMRGEALDLMGRAEKDPAREQVYWEGIVAIAKRLANQVRVQNLRAHFNESAVPWLAQIMSEAFGRITGGVGTGLLGLAMAPKITQAMTALGGQGKLQGEQAVHSIEAVNQRVQQNLQLTREWLMACRQHVTDDGQLALADSLTEALRQNVDVRLDANGKIVGLRIKGFVLASGQFYDLTKRGGDPIRLRPGKAEIIIGPSGVGKSSLVDYLQLALESSAPREQIVFASSLRESAQKSSIWIKIIDTIADPSRSESNLLAKEMRELLKYDFQKAALLNHLYRNPPETRFEQYSDSEKQVLQAVVKALNFNDPALLEAWRESFLTEGRSDRLGLPLQALDHLLQTCLHETYELPLERDFVRQKEYSLGQRQRLLVAAMMNSSASVLLFDEALSGIDPEARMSILARLQIRLEDSGKMSIWVTHHTEDPALLGRATLHEMSHMLDSVQQRTSEQLPPRLSLIGFAKRFESASNRLSQSGPAAESMLTVLYDQAYRCQPYRVSELGAVHTLEQFECVAALYRETPLTMFKRYFLLDLITELYVRKAEDAEHPIMASIQAEIAQLEQAAGWLEVFPDGFEETLDLDDEHNYVLRS